MMIVAKDSFEQVKAILVNAGVNANRVEDLIKEIGIHLVGTAFSTPPSGG